MSNENQETRLDALVDKLYAEGVEKANTEAEAIVAEARSQAETIVKQAREEAARLVKEGKSRAESFQTNAVASVKQSARDVVLALETSIRDLFNKAFKAETAKLLDDPDFLGKLISDLAKTWAEGKDVTVAVKPEVAEKILATAKKSLKEQLGDGIELKTGNIASGFRIRKDGDAVAYDFTDDSILDLLKAHLNPQLVQSLEL